MSIFGNIVHGVVHTVTSATHTIVHAAEGAGESIAHTATGVAGAAEQEAGSVGSAISKFGHDAVSGVANGATWAAGEVEEGAEKVAEGAVAVGKFISANACSAAVGTALGATVAALSTDGEEEVSMAALAAAVAAAKKLGGIAAIQEAATLVAAVIADAIWVVPGVSGGGITKAECKSVIKFSIMMGVKANTEEVIETGGQFLTGVILTVLTAYICTGLVPDGFRAWEKENG